MRVVATFHRALMSKGDPISGIDPVNVDTKEEAEAKVFEFAGRILNKISSHTPQVNGSWYHLNDETGIGEYRIYNSSNVHSSKVWRIVVEDDGVKYGYIHAPNSEGGGDLYFTVRFTCHPDKVVDAIKEAANAFLHTDAGVDLIASRGIPMTWDEMAEIPAEYLNKYGLVSIEANKLPQEYIGKVDAIKRIPIEDVNGGDPGYNT